MTKQDIINHILKTPSNTNPAVLSGLLDDFGSSDNKQEVELSATENKVYTPEEGKVYNKVTVNVPAPPSDMTTAEVILENNEALYTWTIYAPILDSNAVIVDEVSGGGTFTMPLYKGQVILDGTDYAGGVPTITGNCVYENNNFIITGDCTIVFA